MSNAPASGNLHTRRIADFVSGLRYEAIPNEVVDRIKLMILDSIGCAIFGTELEWSRILIDTLTEVDTSKGCTVWGAKERLSAPHAALVNGSLVQSFELDDVHRVGVLHVGAVTLPAVLAAMEMHPESSGRDFLTASVAGYEIGPRVGMCMGQEHIGQGWHSGATVGVFSAAAGAAAALHLSSDQTVHAIGIGGTQSSGLMAAQYGAMVKRMHAGRAAQSGLYGALLAARGYTGIQDVFESPYGGFCTTFSRSTDRFNMDELSSGLGERFETTRIALKFYSCVGSNHTTLDAISDLQAAHGFKLADIEKITVYGSKVTADHVGWKYRPEGLTSAQLNLPYCVATLLLEGDVFVDQFTEAMVADPTRMKVAEIVEVLEDPDITARGNRYRHMVRVEILLKSGKKFEQTVESPRGSEQKFATSGDVIEKFRKLASRRLKAASVERLVQMIMAAETMPKVSSLLAELAAG